MLLSVKNLSVNFAVHNAICRAVNNVSFSLRKGETLGIVGESGAGKSVGCYSLTGLLPSPPALITKGEALFSLDPVQKTIDLLKLSENQLRKIRGRSVSIIFQDPMTSLNPYMPIGKQIAEPLIKHYKVSSGEARLEVLKMLEDVGIPEPLNRIKQYPHEFSGGMRQRIMIAMALITKPELLIADEPTTALDVTVQAQILNLLKKLQNDFGMGIIFITHDLGVVAEICDNVNVMYAGQIMEKGSVKDIFECPKHPYTIMLKKSLPKIKGKVERLYHIPGMPPDMTKEIKGCPFASRCDRADKKCFNIDKITLNDNKKHCSTCIKNL
jgi:oligopeptide transport system ATP-binding protein